MLLPLPNLDDRRWSDLAEEGRNLIPRYAPEWTDFNVHDPGITLVELFAWLAEMDIFRLNRIPAAHRRKFLALLGVTLQPPQAAQTLVQFSLPAGAAPVNLPATIEVETRDAIPFRFRTSDDLTVVATDLEALARLDQQGLQDLTPLWRSGEPLVIFGELPQAGSAFYFGFREPLPEGKTVTLYLRFAGCKSDVETRQRLQEEWLAAEQTCLSRFNPCQPRAQAQPSTMPKNLSHHSVRTVWEFAQSVGGNISWRILDPEADEVIDETRALTLDGFVRFKLPARMAVQPNSPHNYLRCRLVSGEYDAPPILESVFVNAVAAEQAVPAGSNFIIAANATGTFPPDSPPIFSGKFTLRFNAAGEISALNILGAQAETPEFFITQMGFPAGARGGVLGCELKLLGKGLEEPLQEVSLQPAPVQSHSVEIFTLADEQWQTWSWRPDFETSSRCDRHFLLDETAGKVTFGDGEKGLPAPKDALIFARFRATTAEKGNVLAGKISRLSRSAHNQALIDETAYSALVTISNPYDATGGAAKESLAHAEGRALQEVYRVTRAVTISDIEQLALTTPGTCIARVAVKANLDARYPCLLAPGVTTVILLPQISARAAQPSAGLRAAVRSYLDRRRILGNRIEVLGPVYTKVTVQARVQSETDANASRVRQDILRALDDFFHPLYGGPEGSGWPFGRDIYRSEVLHVIDGVAGVENVVGLELIANEGEPSCGNLCIGPCGLVISGEHEITVD